jgi:plasmid stability protein
MPTITIRNLQEEVKQKLRVLAAQHGNSMEAEARLILTREVQEAAPATPATGQRRFEHLVGLWKDRGTTDEMMRDLRGDEE